MDHKIGQLSQPERATENGSWLENTVTTLQQRVTGIGIDRDVRFAVENNIQKNPDRFDLRLETETGSEKLGLKLHFIKEGSDFEFPGYEATLFHHTPITYGHMNGIDTRALDDRMKNADWHFGIAESEEKVLNGYKNTEAIEADLRQLSQSEQEGIVAAQLWNNHVPANTVAKPDFITGIEATHNLYPTSTFPADMKITEACDVLKAEYQEQQLAGDRALLRPEFAFYESEPGEIKQHLQQLQADGNKYVAYIEDSVPMTKENLHGCKNTFDAMEFAYENSNGLDRCTFSTIQRMNDAVHQWERFSEKDINLIGVEQKMASTDWYYNKASPSREHWEKADANMGEIQKDLALLSKLPGGMDKANALWDKYAPPGTVSKPYFLSANPQTSTDVVQGQNAVTSGQEAKESKLLTTASKHNQAALKPETPAKEKKQKQRRRLE